MGRLCQRPSSSSSGCDFLAVVCFGRHVALTQWESWLVSATRAWVQRVCERHLVYMCVFLSVWVQLCWSLLHRSGMEEVMGVVGAGLMLPAPGIDVNCSVQPNRLAVPNSVSWCSLKTHVVHM